MAETAIWACYTMCLTAETVKWPRLKFGHCNWSSGEVWTLWFQLNVCNVYLWWFPFKSEHTMFLLSVETHRRAATGNTKSRACHLTYTRSGGCKRAPNSFLRTKTRVNISPSRGRLPGTNLASALKNRSSPGVRWDLFTSGYDKISK